MFKATRDGLAEVLLVNDALRGFEPRVVFPWHLSIVIRAQHLVEQGMPDPEEQVALNEIGDELELALKAAKTEFNAPNVLYFARSTWSGERELLFRVHDPETANRVLLEKIAEKTWTRVWDFRMKEDRDWSLTASIISLYPVN